MPPIKGWKEVRRRGAKRYSHYNFYLGNKRIGIAKIVRTKKGWHSYVHTSIGSAGAYLRTFIEAQAFLRKNMFRFSERVYG